MTHPEDPAGVSAPGDTPATGRTPETAGALLAAALTHHGVRRIFGAPTDGLAGIGGLPHVRVDEPNLAAGLAAAAGHVGPGPGAALLPGRRLLVGAAPGLRTEPVAVTGVDHLMELVATWDRDPAGASVEILLDLDLDEPIGGDTSVLRADEGLSGMILAPGLRGAPMVVVAGPGVQRQGRVEALRTLARSGGLPVVTTAGATGMLAGDDPLFAGVVGIQTLDADLSGVAAAEVVIATGLDDGVGLDVAGEPGGGLTLPGFGGQVLQVAPSHLATLGLRWQPPDPPEPVPSALRHRMDNLAGELAVVPGSPVAACMALGTVARSGSVVAADGGTPGLWLARLRSPAAPGTLRLPGLLAPGFALSAALVAALDGRRAVAVVNDPGDPVSAALTELAVMWNLDLVVVGWGPGAAGDGTVARDHNGGPDGDEAGRLLAGLRAAMRSPGVVQVGFDVDPGVTAALEDACGPVVGWPPGPPAA